MNLQSTIQNPKSKSKASVIREPVHIPSTVYPKKRNGSLPGFDGYKHRIHYMKVLSLSRRETKPFVRSALSAGSSWARWVAGEPKAFHPLTICMALLYWLEYPARPGTGASVMFKNISQIV